MPPRIRSASPAAAPYVGLHPCFTGPFAEQPREDGARVVHPGYRQAGWRTGGPGTVVGGLTDRVGFRHLPLGAVLSSVLDAGLLLVRVEEGGNSGLPDWLVLVARTPRRRSPPRLHA